MPRKLAMLIALSCVLAGVALAQGLTTQASKDDWEEINFEFNSATLSDGYPSLLCLADQLHKNAGYHVKVEGNTDNIGSERVNEKLGLARANTVRDFLVKYGASPSQIEVSTRGKRDQKYPGYKSAYSPTDVARWMNRRVVLTVTDQNGRTVAAGCGGQLPPQAQPTTTAAGGPNCCNDILSRLDRITKLLEDLKGENDDLKGRIAKLEKQEQAIDTTVNNLPKPPSADEIGKVIDAHKDPRFALLGVNLGADDLGHVTFTGSGRYFAPFKEHFAIQAQAEYLYYRTQKEGQADIGLVDRIGNFQGGLFASFKNVSMSGYNNGTIGQGSLVLDWLFKDGRIGLFGSKGFMNNAYIGQQNTTFTDASGNTVIAPNIFLQSYLHVIDQVGVQGTLGLWGKSYMEANVGYLKSFAHADRPGGTVRFVLPVSDHIAVTVEGGLNETLLAAGNSGRAVVGLQFGNLLRPKDFTSDDVPVPMQVPRVRYEVLTKTVHKGVSPPIADAGPDQLGVAAGVITLNGSGSRDPNGEALTYQWIQETGPTVALSAANQAVTTFTATAGSAYQFRLTVTNTDNQQATARTRVTTLAVKKVSIDFFYANPSSITAGQSSTLAYKVKNATSVSISPGVGSVNVTNGTISVQPTATTTYTLTATGTSGSVTSTATVTVTTPQPQLSVCTAVPMTITQGESSTIYYNTLNATAVTITPGVGSVPVNGNTVVTPTATTTYTVTATNLNGTANCTVAIQVVPGAMPQIVKFSGSPLTIAKGGTSTLLWVAENATSVSIDQGVGNVAIAGTQDVTPAQTTTYTLTATNKFGSVTAQVTINVTQPPPPPTTPAITSFTATPPQSSSPGTPIVLSCQTTNAIQVAISGVGLVDKTGHLTVSPTQTITYVCVATGSGGAQASANLTVPVGGANGVGPTVVVSSPNGVCQRGSPTSAYICQTVNDPATLVFTSSTSPNPPIMYSLVASQASTAVMSPTSGTPQVQLPNQFGDYFFTLTETDSKGNSSNTIIDVQYVPFLTPTPASRRPR